MDSNEVDSHTRLLDKRQSYRVNIRKKKKQHMIQQCRNERIQYLDEEANKQIRTADEQQGNNCYEQRQLQLVEQINLLMSEPDSALQIGRVTELLNAFGSMPDRLIQEHGEALCHIAMKQVGTYEGGIFAGVLASQPILSKYLLRQNIIQCCLELIQQSQYTEMVRIWVYILYQLVRYSENIGVETREIPKNYLLLLEKSKNSRHYNQMLHSLSFFKDYLPQQDMVIRTLFETRSHDSNPTKRLAAENIIGNFICLATPSVLLSYLNELLEYCCQLLSSNNQLKRRSAKTYLKKLIKKTAIEASELAHMKQIMHILGTRISIESMPDQIQSLELATTIYAGATPELFDDLFSDPVIEYIVMQALTSDNVNMIKPAIMAVNALLGMTGPVGMGLVKMGVRKLLETLAYHIADEITKLASKVLSRCPEEHETLR